MSPPLPEGYDAQRVENAIREILIAVGEDPNRPGLRDTPARVARSYAEIFAGLHQDASDVLTRTVESGHDEKVRAKDLEMFSTCEDHIVPLHDMAPVAYDPAAPRQPTHVRTAEQP